jgi:predicted DNA-binding transcriptional regulator AlpA
MTSFHPSTTERMSANIKADTAQQLSPELCAMPRLLTQKHLAAYLFKSEAWCERARWAGDGPRFIKLGRHVRYRADDVLAWIEESARTSTTGQ